MGSAQLPTSSSIPNGAQHDRMSKTLSDPHYFAGIPLKRIIAYLVDVVAIAVLTVSISVITFVPVVLTLGMPTPFAFGMMALLPLAYHTLMIGGDRPATLGMRLMGIEVRKLSGAKPGHGLALMQTILFYVTISLTTWLILLVALFNNKHQTLHDFFCGTMVINVAHSSAFESGSPP